MGRPGGTSFRTWTRLREKCEEVWEETQLMIGWMSGRTNEWSKEGKEHYEVRLERAVGVLGLPIHYRFAALILLSSD